MLDTRSEAGYNACAQYLDQLDMAARALSLEPAPRAYRGEFTIKYRALFPNEAWQEGDLVEVQGRIGTVRADLRPTHDFAVLVWADTGEQSDVIFVGEIKLKKKQAYKVGQVEGKAADGIWWRLTLTGLNDDSTFTAKLH